MKVFFIEVFFNESSGEKKNDMRGFYKIEFWVFPKAERIVTKTFRTYKVDEKDEESGLVFLSWLFY